MKRMRGKKGRIQGRITPQKALADVRDLLGDAARSRDLLVEHLHKLQDHYGHLSHRHLLALAIEMELPMAEVYETATFTIISTCCRPTKRRRRHSRCGCVNR